MFGKTSKMVIFLERHLLSVNVFFGEWLHPGDKCSACSLIAETNDRSPRDHNHITEIND